MGMRTVILRVDGMSCSACEARISKALGALDGVSRAEASAKSGTASVYYDDGIVDEARIKSAIEGAGYVVRQKGGLADVLPFIVGFALIGAYLFADSRGIFASIPSIRSSIGFAALFAVGLLTSIHCVAMCGGIALSQGIGRTGAQDGDGGRFAERFIPGALYNAGRVASYTAVGAIVGAIGSVFSFSPTVKGIITGIAGALMLAFGLRMLGVFRGMPDLSRFTPKPLKRAFDFISSRLAKGGPFAVGILSGLMPCGPLQAMQLYALGTGNALTGALSMLIFSLGTIPLMLAFGTGAALLPKKFLPAMMKTSALLVIFLGLATFGRAATLAGAAMPTTPAIFAQGPAQNVIQRSADDPDAGEVTELADFGSGYAAGVSSDGSSGIAKSRLASGMQTVTTEFKNGRYAPIAVQEGIPVRWTIRINANDLTGCNETMVIPAYGIQKKLEAGDNVIEFTPTKSGTIGYSCWMGMIRSTITVVKDISAAKAVTPKTGGAGSNKSNCCAGMTARSF